VCVLVCVCVSVCVYVCVCVSTPQVFDPLTNVYEIWVELRAVSDTKGRKFQFPPSYNSNMADWRTSDAGTIKNAPRLIKYSDVQ
jgi:hypothetical protein